MIQMLGLDHHILYVLGQRLCKYLSGYTDPAADNQVCGGQFIYQQSLLYW